MLQTRWRALSVVVWYRYLVRVHTDVRYTVRYCISPAGTLERQRRFNASKRQRKSKARAARLLGVNALGVPDVGFAPVPHCRSKPT